MSRMRSKVIFKRRRATLVLAFFFSRMSYQAKIKEAIVLFNLYKSKEKLRWILVFTKCDNVK